MQAVILSGGKGSRLWPLTKHTPKPMLPINGVPHLEYQIRLLELHGVYDIIFSTGYLHHLVEEYFGDGSSFGVNIRYKEDGDVPLGTAGALRNCLDIIDDGDVMVLNGDILTNADLTSFSSFYRSGESEASIMLVQVDEPSQYGVAMVKDGYIKQFVEKPNDSAYGNLINAGIYAMNKKVIASIPVGYSMLETDVFPQLAAASQVTGYVSEQMFWIDIGTHDRYRQAQNGFVNIS